MSAVQGWPLLALGQITTGISAFRAGTKRGAWSKRGWRKQSLGTGTRKIPQQWHGRAEGCWGAAYSQTPETALGLRGE